MYYGNALKIDTKVVFAIIRAISAGLANRTTFTELKLRWGGNAYRAATEGTDDIVDSDGSVKWHPQFGHNRFFGFYGVNFNFGTNYWGGSFGTDGTQIDNNSSVEISGEKLNWIMDASDASSTIWVKDPEMRPASLNRTNQTNYITTSVTYSEKTGRGCISFPQFRHNKDIYYRTYMIIGPIFYLALIEYQF